MISGPVVVQVLEGENAIAKNREVMGATNPANAAAGTIRKDFAESIEANSVHGSDAPETAANEIAYFFTGTRYRRLRPLESRAAGARASVDARQDRVITGATSGIERWRLIAGEGARIVRSCRGRAANERRKPTRATRGAPATCSSRR